MSDNCGVAGLNVSFLGRFFVSPKMKNLGDIVGCNKI